MSIHSEAIQNRALITRLNAVSKMQTHAAFVVAITAMLPKIQPCAICESGSKGLHKHSPMYYEAQPDKSFSDRVFGNAPYVEYSQAGIPKIPATQPTESLKAYWSAERGEMVQRDGPDPLIHVRKTGGQKVTTKRNTSGDIEWMVHEPDTDIAERLDEYGPSIYDLRDAD